MPEVIFPGPEGRLEGRFAPGPRPRAPVAMILHPHPSAGGTMNNAIVQQLYKTFQRRGFATLRFNFRGVGKSQGVFDNGVGELSDAASALDWVQSFHPEAQTTWIAGVSFGAWIGMQLLMRRPEIRGFISIAPPANLYDFTFLAPCPSSGIIIQGEGDEVATPGATHQQLHADPRTEADARDPGRLRLGVEALHPVECTRRIAQLADAVVEHALALANAAEVEPQSREAAPLESLVELLHDRVVHSAAGRRMRVQDHRDGCTRTWARRKTTFETAFGTGKNDFWHGHSRAGMCTRVECRTMRAI